MVRNASQASDTDAHVHLPPDVGKAEKAESTSSGFKVDPYAFGSGLKTEEELGELRRRRKGVERYHREQNDVRIANWHSRPTVIHYLRVFSTLILQLIKSLLKPMEEHTEDAKEEEEAYRLPVCILLMLHQIPRSFPVSYRSG